MTEQQVNDIHQLIGTAACALDNLFGGTAEYPTGINAVKKAFTKNDLKTLHKAADLLDRLGYSFDGTRKQRGTS